MDGGMFDMRTPNTSATTPQFSHSQSGLIRASMLPSCEFRIDPLRDIHWNQDNTYLSGKQMISGQPLAVQLFAKATRMRIVRQTKIDGRRYSNVLYHRINRPWWWYGCRRRGIVQEPRSWLVFQMVRQPKIGSHGISTGDPRLAFSYQTKQFCAINRIKF